MIFIGILLEITAAALGTLSKQLIAISEHLKKPWLFHIGATINIAVGPIVDASAYAFAPQVIVAPFACLDVIFNALTAPYTLKWQNEKLTKVHLIGTGFVAAGAVLTSVFADAENEVYTVYELESQLLRPESLIYLSTEFFLILVATLLLRRDLLSSRVRGISLGVIAGVLMGNVFFMKGLIGLIRHSLETGEVEAWVRVTPYICLIAAAGGAIVGHMFMRKGLGEYKGVFMVTIFEGAHIAAACLSGCVVMSEMSGAAWWRYVSYWASVLMITVGMLAINTAAADSKMGRSFHIAQSFTEDDEKNALKGAESSVHVGRVLDDYDWEDMLEEGGFPAADSDAHALGDSLSRDKLTLQEKVEESTTGSTCTPEEAYMQEVLESPEGKFASTWQESQQSLQRAAQGSATHATGSPRKRGAAQSWEL